MAVKVVSHNKIILKCIKNKLNYQKNENMTFFHEIFFNLIIIIISKNQDLLDYSKFIALSSKWIIKNHEN